ncbi:hypothetical protein C8J57DRAFT_1213890 [Mycena rebaudengoi]|nr:hypothetical protein C8J57DRAFT_1213890 [Mycena rebaudengoi]
MSHTAEPASCEFCSFRPSPLLPHSSQTSHLVKILRSNLPAPSPDIISHFRNVTSSTPFELARYDEKISRVQNQLISFMRERDELRAYAAGCASVFSPIRRVPNEVLVEIFAMCSQPSEISAGTTPQEEIYRLRKQDLSRLLQVCSYWNHVVMSTSQYRAIVRDILTTSLRRGGSFPLQISVYAGHDAQQHQWGFELLSQHSHRWRRVSLALSLPFLTFLASARGRFPLLEELEINGWDRWPENPDIFAIAPRLTTLTLNISARHIPPNLPLPWEQLMKIKCCHFVTAWLPNILPFLARLPIGAELQLQIGGYASPLVRDFPTAASNISSLRVMLSSANLGTAVGQIIQSLIAPRTRTVRSSLKDTLEMLELKCLTIIDAELIQCLSELPLLQTLSLSDSLHTPASSDHILLTDDLFHGLALRPDIPPLIPDLQSFEILSLFHFSAQAYRDFVRSRIVPGTPRGSPFVANMVWFPGRKPDPPPDLSEMIAEEAVSSLFVESADSSEW